MTDLERKYEALLDYLSLYDSIAVAFSGGVDSSLLLYAARESVGDRAIAITATSPLFPKREIEEAKSFCDERGIEQVLFETHELETEGFRDNPTNRCYLCKSTMLARAAEIAKERGLAIIAEGSNVDDENDYRPGFKAVEEAGAISPLKHVGLTKNEIREISKDKGLSTWNKQSFACLGSRFAYGDTLSDERLEMVDKAEQALLDLGFHQVRVRFHGTIARVELPVEEFSHAIEEGVRGEIVGRIKDCGFEYVVMDLAGYKTGSMNTGVQ